MIWGRVIHGWMFELCVVNGVLLGFTLPMPHDKQRIWGVNLLVVCLLWYRADQ